jgi:hypothetical protein
MVVAFMMGAPFCEMVDTQLHFGTLMPFRVEASIPLLSRKFSVSGGSNAVRRLVQRRALKSAAMQLSFAGDQA